MKSNHSDANKLRNLRLFPEYGTKWPIWDAEDDDTAHTLDLTEAVRVDMLRWVEEWEQGYNYLRGWTSPKRRDAWFLEGDDIAQRLRNELSGIATIEARYRQSYDAVESEER